MTTTRSELADEMVDQFGYEREAAEAAISAHTTGEEVTDTERLAVIAELDPSPGYPRMRYTVRWSAPPWSIDGLEAARRHAATYAEAMALATSGVRTDRSVSITVGEPSRTLWRRDPAGRAAASVVGPQEIAERLGVRPATVYQWRQRGVLPEPARMLSGVPVWEWSTVEAWARSTGRL